MRIGIKNPTHREITLEDMLKRNGRSLSGHSRHIILFLLKITGGGGGNHIAL